jgi:hypothetical protein
MAAADLLLEPLDGKERGRELLEAPYEEVPVRLVRGEGRGVSD